MAGEFKGLTVKFRGDDSELSAALHRISEDAAKARGNARDFQKALRFDPGNTDALKGKNATQPPCPVCGHRYELAAGYVERADGKKQALCVCGDHGLYTVTISFQKGENGRKAMVRACALAEEQNPAYISTKLIQWQNKLAAQEARKEAEGA